MWWFTLLAQGAPAGGGGGAAPTGGGPDMLLIMMLAFLPLFYFMVMRPAQKQEKDRKATIAGLKKNDEVITNGGMVGTVIQIKEKAVGGEDLLILRIDDKVKIPVVRSGVYRVVARAEGPPLEETKEPAKESSSK